MASTVGIRELKNALSRWLRLVQSGESVIVLDHGRPVAVLSAAASSEPPRTTTAHLANLATRGLVILGSGRRRRAPKHRPRVDLSGAVADDRGERA